MKPFSVNGDMWEAIWAHLSSHPSSVWRTADQNISDSVGVVVRSVVNTETLSPIYNAGWHGTGDETWQATRSRVREVNERTENNG